MSAVARAGASVLAACASACGTLAPALPDASGWRVTFQEEFDADGGIPDGWVLETPGARRDATNVAQAVSVDDGVLTVVTSTEAGGHETAMLSTRGSFEQAQGCFEARIDFDAQPGTWSAFWLYCDPPSAPLGDPAQDGVEIDVAEHRAQDERGTALADRVTSALHWRAADGALHSVSRLTLPLALDDGFHTYTLLWSEAGYAFHVDGALVWRRDGPVSARPQFLVLSSEVENGGWAGPIPGGGYGPRTSSVARMRVDWVRAYAR